MPVPPAPPPLEQLGQLPFSFHPPVEGIESNAWRYSGCTWSEVLVRNLAAPQEIAIARRWIGSVTTQDDGCPVIQLLKPLELNGGVVRPVHRRVIEMPAPADALFSARSDLAPGSVTPIRLDGASTSRLTRVALATLALGVAAAVLLTYLDWGEIIDARAAMILARPRHNARPVEARQF